MDFQDKKLFMVRPLPNDLRPFNYLYVAYDNAYYKLFQKLMTFFKIKY